MGDKIYESLATFKRMKKFISYLYNILYDHNNEFTFHFSGERLYHWKIGEDHLL